jgi:hypothetical protein
MVNTSKYVREVQSQVSIYLFDTKIYCSSTQKASCELS